MSASVQSLEIQRALVAHFPLPGTPEERSLDWAQRMFRVFLGSPGTPTGLRDRQIVILIPQDDPAVANLNLMAARQAERQGKKVAYRYLDSDGRPLGGTIRRLPIDLRDSRWGTEPREELEGQTAAQLRERFHAIMTDSQVGEPVGLAYENIVVLNGVRIYLLDEQEPGFYLCLAFERAPN